MAIGHEAFNKTYWLTNCFLSLNIFFRGVCCGAEVRTLHDIVEICQVKIDSEAR